ncbi:peptide-methionine (S)-S-oxide reductase MsrA [Candidatus Fermentibacterales bacterium]|nr:peptide-methionine (S)-S-oxide reductase MsrA [Candidatus Fermentibacterales bacterium]
MAKQEKAILAGGCFWGVEYRLKTLPGVVSTQVGYSGGSVPQPTYEQVCSGSTGHAEAVEITFDPETLSFEQLVRRFFEIHDPTQRDRQGADVGKQYRSAVFYFDEGQKGAAERLIAVLRGKGFDVVTELSPAGAFWRAEEYHQDYFEKNREAPICHTCVNRFGLPGRA